MAQRLPNTLCSAAATWSAVAFLGAGAMVGCLDERSLESAKVTIISGGAGEAGSGAGDDPGGAQGGSANDAGSTGSSNGGSTGGVAAGSGGSAFAAGMGNEGGTSASGGTCGCSANGGTGQPIDTRCPDLDDNRVLDCDETLAKNAAFDLDVKNWSLETGVELSWSDKDGQSHDDSGSLALDNQVVDDLEGTSMVGAHQCLAISGGTVYRFASQISVPDYAGETRAGLQILLYDNAACTGKLLDHPSTNLVKGAEWKVAEIMYLTPPATKSVRVRLVSIKPFRQTPLPVLFDNVLVRTQ